MMDKGECTATKICPFSLGLSIGVVTGLYMLLLAWVALFKGYGVDMVHQVASVYLGYAPTIVGGVIGGVWGLVDGFVFGFIVGWIYNFVHGRCKKAESK